MRQIDFKTATNLDNLKQIEQALLICFFHYKQTGEQQFDATMVNLFFRILVIIKSILHD